MGPLKSATLGEAIFVLSILNVPGIAIGLILGYIFWR